MAEGPAWIEAQWPAPPRVRALTTLRTGGVSAGPYAGLNLAGHVGDAPEAVAENRRRLRAALALPAEPAWLRQVHGTRVVEAPAGAGAEADGAWTARPGVVLAVLTADCLPVVLARRDGGAVAVAHAGWRGLAAGVLEAAVAALGGGVVAWIGPAIGAAAYEVGPEVREAVLAADPGAAEAMRPSPRAGRWRLDLAAAARRRLRRAGVEAVAVCGRCTFREAAAFYSYRRDGVTGRMATLAWIEPGRSHGLSWVPSPAEEAR
ncbi:peptidoglycan editing factor PgeF [Inmirania thermothiophila]|uniref:Purine nucleoside phosphorylase n=1 Tax=Inmirania thermothiophila TaxID=1750597 RepID=A0A3N1Y7B0_9GAMM|nr:peptidoglycan editing factor PgeF [Inmirania thermothiophila]ROR34706.1 hypothetical protein EDC57_0608 [Inmirania thermothiophila]